MLEYIAYVMVLALARFARIVPLGILLRVGGWMGSAGHVLVPVRKKIVLANLHEGDVVGAAAMVNQGTATASAVALENLVVLHLARTRFLDEAKRRPEIMKYLQGLSAERAALQESKLNLDPSEASTEQILLI